MPRGTLSDAGGLQDPQPLPTPWPDLGPPVSGLYERRGAREWPNPTTKFMLADPEPIPWQHTLYEELRIDVDRRYPLMVASGTKYSLSHGPRHWIANLTSTGPDSWKGEIWYKEGTPLFIYTHVEIEVTRSIYPEQRKARVTFLLDQHRFPQDFKFKSPFFRTADFEYDFTVGEDAITSIDTCAHHNRPLTLACENLSIGNVFERTGFHVTNTPGASVPLIGAKDDERWSDQEMHDAMQEYWSRFAPQANWAVWTFFASLHEYGENLGGIMFDSVGTNQRQGCAIFNDSFIAVPPQGDPSSNAWINRSRFFTAVHEIGHCFNLAHSWQKDFDPSWIPIANESLARSFMNYPDRVGNHAFFSDFHFRFSDSELLFMRHAPARFVQPGNANWFDQHGFANAPVSDESSFQLSLRTNRENEIFDFMEPVTLELKLTSVSREPQVIDKNLLRRSESMIVIIKKLGKQARKFEPYAHHCWVPRKRVVLPGESLYESLFISAGLNGWDISEPGVYKVQIALRADTGDIISNPLQIRILPPLDRNEEILAQEFFSDEIGRILAFGGSRFLTKGNNILREITSKLTNRKVALYANLVLGNVLARNYKMLTSDQRHPRGLGIKVLPPQIELAQKYLSEALVAKPEVAAESFGHINYKRYCDSFTDRLAENGNIEAATKVQDTLLRMMSARSVHGRKILDSVLQEIKVRLRKYTART